eukprot:1189762-Prorocentrum_minimum.AAC.1
MDACYSPTVHPLRSAVGASLLQQTTCVYLSSAYIFAHIGEFSLTLACTEASGCCKVAETTSAC